MCEFCKMIIENDPWTEPELLKIPFTMQIRDTEVDIGRVTIETSYDDEAEPFPQLNLQLCFYTDDEVIIESMPINYCPNCGMHVKEAIINHHPNITRTETVWIWVNK